MRATQPEASQPAPTARDAAGGDPRRALARRGEQAAAEHLERLGYAILARNVRSARGEIDLIAFGEDAVVFVEVKTRRCPARAGARTGGPEPLAGLGARQRARLRGLALAWLCDGQSERPRAAAVRFDAIGVCVDARGRLLRLDHVQAAW